MTLALVLGLCACGSKAPTWQEQYDLGVRYLSEGNYQEAILAFTAAIEIEPNRAALYAGRGDAYEALSQLETAVADYLKAVDLDGAVAGYYGRLADLYLALGDGESAIAILERGYEATGDEELLTRLEELRPEESGGPFWRLAYMGQYTPDGVLTGDTTYTYREDGYCQEWVTWAYSWLNGRIIESVDWPTQYTYDEAAGTVTLHYIHFGEETSSRTFDWVPGSVPVDQKAALFNENFGQWSTYLTGNPYGQNCVAFADFYVEGEEHDSYEKKYGEETYTVRNEWDENGNLTAAYTYDAGGALTGYFTFQYEYFSAE